MPSGKAPGNDRITVRILNCCLSSNAPTLTTIVNASLTSSTFPLTWKTAEVTPIFKQGDHEKPENNRPISLLPILSKVCEQIALNQFVPYLESNKRLSSTQSGNKQFHSTETSLVHTIFTAKIATDLACAQRRYPCNTSGFSRQCYSGPQGSHLPIYGNPL